MNKEQLKIFLSSRYQGWQSFLDNIIFPIFGTDNFEDSHETELLDAQPERRKLADATGIRSIKQLGQMDIGVERLFIFDVTVGDHIMMERNRVNIQRLIRDVMEYFSCAFMVFHYEDSSRWEWRFSYCRKSGNRDETTDSKRYTFLLGPGQSCRTAAENFMALYAKRESLQIRDIEDAFNVEALSIEFYGKYEAQFDNFVSYMTAPENGMRSLFIDNSFDHEGLSESAIRHREEKPIRDYVKKLLGRIVFLHFLQKKGWLGVPNGEDWGNGDREFMLKLFENATTTQQDNFLDDILEPLFSKGFDTNRGDDGDIFDTGVSGFRDCRIPYLNGGLFERDQQDENPSHFPASYFKDLLTMLSQYNFTIDENDPNDAEVGVDPEMLGRIFENLLDENKEQGVYYTPKEVVKFMCKESLIAYLQKNKTEEERERIQKFVSVYDAEVLGGMKDDVDRLLRDVKICDPAIGSGAFPMGMLRELFFCRCAIQPNLIDNSVDIKRHIIQNNIYGVDIERGAVDIARLRFWLSLIVDEKTPETLPNLDFKVMQGNSLLESFEGIDLSKLATLADDVKIFSPAKDLFGEYIDKRMQIIFETRDEILKFQNNLSAYFATDNHSERETLRVEIDSFIREQLEIVIDRKIHQLNRQIAELENNLDIPKRKKSYDEAVNKLSYYSEVQKKVCKLSSQNSEFFLWHTWFHDVFANGGFDIVIGNPPYIKEYTNRAAFNGYRETSPYYIGKMDLWHGFACHGLDFAVKDGGVLCFIAQNNWTTNAGAKKLRDKVVDECRILKMLDFNDYMVFSRSASIQTMIMLFVNDDITDNYSIDYRRLLAGAKKQDMIDLLNAVESNKTEYFSPIFKRDFFRGGYITFSKLNAILEKIANTKECFCENEIAQGIVFPQDFLNKKAVSKLGRHKIGDGVFGLSQDELDNLHLSEIEKKSLIKPYYTSSELHRYFSKRDSNRFWLIYTTSEFKNPNSLDEYPRVKHHLDQFLSILTSDNKPYGLHRAREERFFKGQKILSLRKCSGLPSFTYSDFDCYVTQTYFIIQTDRWDMKFLTGLLNSKLIAFWLKHKGKMQGGNYQIDKEPLVNIPLPQTNVNQIGIIKEVESILTKLGQNIKADISREEAQINFLVYNLYGLSDAEIELIENDL